MAISKKNKMLQCPIPKEEYEQLDAIVTEFRKQGIPCTKGHIVTIALQYYVKNLVLTGKALEIKHNEEEPQKEKRDA